MENGPGLKMYFLLKMWIFQPAMLVYQVRKIFCGCSSVSFALDNQSLKPRWGERGFTQEAELAEVDIETLRNHFNCHPIILVGE